MSTYVPLEKEALNVLSSLAEHRRGGVRIRARVRACVRAVRAEAHFEQCKRNATAQIFHRHSLGNMLPLIGAVPSLLLCGGTFTVHNSPMLFKILQLPR